MPYPTKPAERKAMRADLLERHLESARRKNAILNRSRLCSGFEFTTEPKHQGTAGGCTNSGTGCLCECHDAAQP